VQWDEACVEICEEDCGGCGIEGEADTVERLIDAAVERGATVGALVGALKDRLLTDGAVDDEEAAILEAVLGLPLDLTVEAALETEAFEASVRLVCGALLRTPDFLLELERATVAAPPELTLDGASDCARMQFLLDAVGHSVACPVGG